MMTPRSTLPVLSLALVLACTSASKTSEPAAGSTKPDPVLADPADPVGSEPSPTGPVLPDAPEFASGPFEVCLEGRGCKPHRPSETFVHEDGPDMQHHSWAFGWTADGSAFAYCEPQAPFCESCIFTKPSGEIEKLIVREAECTDEGTDVSAKQLRQRLADRGVALRDGDWAHGGELIVSIRTFEGAPDSNDTPRATLEVGTVQREPPGGQVADAYREDACFKDSEGGTACFGEAHAEAIVPSPDGTLVAILGHWWFGEWSDTLVLEIVPAGRLAAATYNRRGLDALGRADFEAAATAFLAAMHADPAAWKGPYNLACAYARAADPRAQPALRAAVERGGDAVRKKAAKDGDLDGVRSQEWFTALIGAAN